MAEELGQRMRVAGIVLRGKLPVTEWQHFLIDVTRKIGMEAVREPVVCAYPIENGKGGTGHSIFLPITESFLVLDTWSDHEGAFLFICSCRPFVLPDVDAVAAEYGLAALKGETRRMRAELNLM
jgi:hypothetical protein